VVATVSFTATIRVRGINPYVLVNHDQVKKLKEGRRKPIPVLVRVNGTPAEPWHINLMPAGDGNFYLYLHGDVRKASNTKAGDVVTIELDFDTEYRNGPLHPMPVWFDRALADNITAKANWNALPPSRQKEVLRYLAALKSDDARERNVARALRALTGDAEHFMGRDWHDGA